MIGYTNESTPMRGKPKVENIPVAVREVARIYDSTRVQLTHTSDLHGW